MSDLKKDVDISYEKSIQKPCERPMKILGKMRLLKSIQQWTKKNLLKRAFKNFEGIWYA